LRNILVTGGAGYIGSHTAKLLARSGYQPVTFDNLSTGHASAVRYGPLVEGDLANTECLRVAIERYRIDAVIHFAASAYVGESVENPRKYFTNNVTNLLNLLHAVLDSGVRYFVFSSTCSTYGNPVRLPIAEDHPQHPINPYGESKLFAERSIRWYGEAYGLHWCALRYFNAAGADPDNELGEIHDPETHLIPLAVQAGQGLQPAIGVYGTDYDTPDGTAIRDYIHVMDLASAHIAALEHLRNNGNSVALNLGTGKGHSVREVIRAVERRANARVFVTELPRRPGDPAVLVANPSKAKEMLGWTPRYSSIESIVDTTWRWETGRQLQSGLWLTHHNRVSASHGASLG
jgi:UDP-arabinose 4-epimerase